MSLEATSDLWWKNAIIYCVDTQSFRDTTGDGVGDLDGLTQEIDYLAGLGDSEPIPNERHHAQEHGSGSNPRRPQPGPWPDNHAPP